MHEKIQLPLELGVMILPGSALFPGSMLPLYIFEPRYQKMLADTLESHRLFGVVSPLDDEASGPLRGGVGVVRACVANDDGTANLVLQGVSRAEFELSDEVNSYPKASVRALESVNSSITSSESLRTEILSLLTKISELGTPIPEQIQEMLSQLQDFDLFSDMAASCLVGDAAVRQRLIEELDATHRLEVLAAYLTHLFATRQEAAD
ncbi:MAG: LON peptidase substrate-binding domain-containing protein [Terrimicrobiaceae bacterium]